jgi:transglutaminase-like putative cysteine protease
MARSSRRLHACFGLIAIAGIPLARGTDMVPLFVVPTESVIATPPTQAPAATLHLYSRETTRLAKALGGSAPAEPGAPLFYALGDYPNLPVDDGAAWLAASFVIDHDEHSVEERYAEFMRESAPGPIADQLTVFVAARVRGSRESRFELASAVARDLKGDCTEYSVLLAALARKAGIPARVAIGVAILQTPSTYQSFGHAWVEMLVDGRWQTFDAALRSPMSPELTLRGYVRYGVLSNEGPGYSLSLAALSQLWLTRVVVVESGVTSAK